MLRAEARQECRQLGLVDVLVWLSQASAERNRGGFASGLHGIFALHTQRQLGRGFARLLAPVYRPGA